MSGLQVEDLCVHDSAGRTLLGPIHLAVAPGGITSLIGESGAGKSLVCGAIAATLPADLKVSGRIWIGGREVAGLPAAARRGLWSHAVFLLPQEPWNALAPARRVAAQTADGPRAQGAGRRDAAATAGRLLDRLGLDPDRDGDRKPWQLSGGMAQRAAVAAALAAPAPLILVDEPTKGLDATLRDRVRDQLRALAADGRAILLVTHDLALACEIGGDLLVMQNGIVVERGAAAEVLDRPRHGFTRALRDALPDRWLHRAAPQGGTPLLRLERVGLDAGAGGQVLARDLSFSLHAGGIVGLWGRSGSGKTTLGDTAIGLRAPAAGRVHWVGDGQAAPRAGTCQKLFQEPHAAFAPWRPIRETMADALSGIGRPRREVEDRLAPILARLLLPPEMLSRRPDQVSGGELQRLAVARLWLARPRVIFADEPTSRLDPLTQLLVAGLLREIADAGSGILLASHDPALLAALCGQIIRLGAPGQARPDLRASSAGTPGLPRVRPDLPGRY